MKILQVSSDVPNSLVFRGSIGGGEDYVSNLCATLANHGHEVTLMLPKPPRESSPRRCSNLQFMFMNSLGSPSRFFGRNPLPLNFLQMSAIKNYDIIHVHHISTFLNLYASVAAKFQQKKVIVTDHGGGGLPFPSRMMMRFFDATAAVSNFSLKRLSRLSPSKKHFVVYCGVDLKVLKRENVSRMMEFKQKLNLEGYFTCLFLGRIMRHKGLEIIIRALAYLPKQTKIVFVGPYYDYQYLQYLRTIIAQLSLSERVIFAGAVTPEEKQCILSMCDVLVCPSVYRDVFGGFHPFSELFGIAKLEAMGSKKPVIVSNTGGLPEGIIDGYNGYVFSSGCVEELGRKMFLLYSDPHLRRRIAEAGYRTVEAEFTWDHVTKRVLSCYEHMQKR